MSIRMRAPRWITGAIAAILAPGIALSIAPSASFAATGSDPVVAAGDDWSVTTTSGGYLVTLELDKPLPVVNDAPTLVVDGQPIGLATESADGLSLSIVTSDADVARASEVSRGWSSGNEEKAADGGEAPVTEEEPPPASMLEKLDAIAEPPIEDPSQLGQYSVSEVEYDFGDQAIPLAGIGGIRGEMTGKLYLSDASGPRPIILLLHGRHTWCDGAGANPLRWPCTPSQVNVRSYLGYEGTARSLASRGYNVVSIAANAINANDNQLALDYGAQARGQLVLDTLTMLENANAGARVSYDDVTSASADSPSVTTTRTLDEALLRATTRPDQPARPGGVTAAEMTGRFDLSHVGLMGHSRGGEGVVAAATLNEARERSYGLEAVLPLAPVDFGRMTLPDVQTAVVLPYCDGDVADQQGQHIVDDSRHAFNDDVLRSAVWVMGANHNFFNSVWTPGLYQFATSDDWYSGDTTSSCSTTSPTRLTAAQQYQVGVSYMTGFFRLAMGQETQFQSMFDGSVKPTTSATPFADVRVMATQPASATTLITDFTKQNSLIRALGAATAPTCMNLAGRSVVQSLPYCATTRVPTQVPHWSPGSFAPNVPEYPVTRFLWTGASVTDPSLPSNARMQITVPVENRNLSARSQITLKTAPDEAVGNGTDFDIAVIDGSGDTYRVAASAINPLAVNRMPGGDNPYLNKIVLQQLTIPVATITGIDLTDVREIRLLPGIGADGTGSGGVYLSDLAFDTPSLGRPSTQNRTTVNVASTIVEEGSGPGSADVAVYLDRPDTTPISAYVSVLGRSTGTVGVGMEEVVFEPGETCKKITVPTLGNTLPSDAPSRGFKVSVSNTNNAVMGSAAFGQLTARDDDGGLVGPKRLPPVGAQGDACAEYHASLAPVALTLSSEITQPGGTVTATATGFRVGEAVLFSIDASPAAEIVADSSGTVAYEAVMAKDGALGRRVITALGSGSARDATAAVLVLAPTSTTLTVAPLATTEGEPITLTATVAGESTAGTVVFTADGTVLGSADTTDGVSSLTVSSLSVGGHEITASFTQTTTSSASVSNSVAVTIARTSTTAPIPPGNSAGTPGDTSTSSTTTPQGMLAMTGGNIAPWIAGLGVLLVIVGGVLGVRRRRRAMR